MCVTTDPSNLSLGIYSMEILNRQRCIVQQCLLKFFNNEKWKYLLKYGAYVNGILGSNLFKWDIVINSLTWRDDYDIWLSEDES